jgi:Tol biopolymer transport system component/DNA-binding winged helix-turn-helix (wHTH) protein
MNQARASTIVRFGVFELDLRARELRKNGHSTGLPEQSVKILTMLLENAGGVVLREEIRQVLWPDDTIVEFDHSINAAVKRLRHALGDSADRPRYIETLARRGYRWKAAFDAESTQPAQSERLFPEVLSEDREPVSDSSPEAREISSLAPNAIFSPAHPPWFVLAISGIVALVVVWLVARRSPLSPPSEIKQTQVTASLPDDAPSSGSISPDGNYLAYADPKGIHVKRLGTGEITNIPSVPDLESAAWYVGPWFPDGQRFVANARTPGVPPVEANSGNTSIWILSLSGGPPRKLRDNALAYSITPKGNFIAFGTALGRYGDREMWLMTPDGNELRKLYEVGEDSSISSLSWSPDGERTVYVQAEKAGRALVIRDAQGGPPATLPVSPNANGIFDPLWLPDGRLLYSQGELGAGWGTCNLWTMRVDSGTGKVLDKPRRVTSWVGSCLVGLSASGDSKKVSFAKWMLHFTVKVGDLDGEGTQVSSLRPFTLSDSTNYPASWTPDSRSLLVWSNRDGHFGIYRQDLDGGSDVRLLSGPGDAGFPEVSPDGAWVLFDEPAQADSSSPVSKIRVPIGGGSREVVATVPSDAQLLCAKSPSGTCVLKEPSKDRKHALFSIFDPVKGRAAEFLRLSVSSNSYFGWDLSPDGKRIVACRAPQGPLQLFSLTGQPVGQIALPELSNMKSLDWAANSKGFYIADAVPNEVILYHVDLDGKAVKLWSQRGATITYGKPSPDGRHIAMLAFTREANLWTLEDF